MADIIHRIGIKAPAARVYEAISTLEGVAGWWTTGTTGEEKLGGTMRVRFHSPKGDDIGGMTFVLDKLSPNQEVRWRMTDGPEEWIGTHVTFNLESEGDATTVLFAHRDWGKQNDFMAHCSMKWATFLLSLRDLVETGKGKPAPDDLKIDNWN